MTGFATWCEGVKVQNKENYPYDLHFNLWIDCCNDYSIPMLDIGIKLEYTEQLEKFCFYLPYLVSRNNIIDLGKIIVSDKKILDSVFNESYTCQELQSAKTFLVNDKNEKEVFRIYALDITEQSDIIVESAYNGTVISIDLRDKNFVQKKHYYFRFRCKSPWLNKIIEKKSKNFLLESISTENNFIDFRLNNWRSFNNSSLIQRIQNKSLPLYCIKKINFFLMTNGEVDINSLNLKSERKLENEIWQEYVGESINNVIIATQWQAKKIDKQKDFIESFNIYARIKKQWCTFKQIIKYVMIFAVINIFYSLLFNFLFIGNPIQINHIGIVLFLFVMGILILILKYKKDC